MDQAVNAWAKRSLWNWEAVDFDLHCALRICNVFVVWVIGTEKDRLLPVARNRNDVSGFWIIASQNSALLKRTVLVTTRAENVALTVWKRKARTKSKIEFKIPPLEESGEEAAMMWMIFRVLLKSLGQPSFWKCRCGLTSLELAEMLHPLCFHKYFWSFDACRSFADAWLFSAKVNWMHKFAMRHIEHISLFILL